MIRNKDTSAEQPAVQLEHQRSSRVRSRCKEPLPRDAGSLVESPFFKNVWCVRETEILVGS